jgi:hypothetical protein
MPWSVVVNEVMVNFDIKMELGSLTFEGLIQKFMCNNFSRTVGYYRPQSATYESSRTMMRRLVIRPKYVGITHKATCRLAVAESEIKRASIW